jgi:hypothetical protein
MIRDMDGCLKCTFPHFITLKKQNVSQSINKYCQECLYPPLQTNKNCQILLLKFVYWSCGHIQFKIVRRKRNES